jgi:hypothetical protein
MVTVLKSSALRSLVNDAQHPNQGPDITSFNAWARAREHLGLVEGLMQHFTAASGIIGEAAAYHLLSGGKRWRPAFMLSVRDALSALIFNYLNSGGDGPASCKA